MMDIRRAARSTLLLLVSSILLSGCTFLQKPENSGIQVITTGVESAVFLDGQHLNTTPLHEKTIQPGEYTLKIVPENPMYAEYETSVTLRSGLLTVVTWKPAETPEQSGGVIYEMEPLNDRTQSEVSFVTIPDGAIVTFQGRERTFSPTILPSVTPGQYEYEITLPSYETQKHTINVIQGYRMNIRAKLAKAAPVSTEPGTSDSTDAANTNESSAPEASVSAAVDATRAAAVGGSQAVSTPSATATGVRILSTNYFSNGQEVLRVRSAAGATGTELGLVPVGEVLPYLGETQSNWHKVSFKREVGWVSAEFSELVE